MDTSNNNLEVDIGLDIGEGTSTEMGMDLDFDWNNINYHILLSAYSPLTICKLQVQGLDHKTKMSYQGSFPKFKLQNISVNKCM